MTNATAQPATPRIADPVIPANGIIAVLFSVPLSAFHTLVVAFF
jgi:hypothetical protein